ncbi:MAG TPA: ATP-binding protein [Negativicutes bacterium]|jgi:signal transduction histidine kinase
MLLWRNLKNAGIAVKLIAIAVSFALPLTVLLVFMIKGINENIQFAELEIKGNFYLQSLETVLQAVGVEERLEYLQATGKNISQEALAVASARTQQALDQLAETDQQLGTTLQFTVEGLEKRNRLYASVPAVRQKWEAIHLLKEKEQNPDRIISVYGALRADIRAMITHAGDNSNLILDPDLDTYYLMDVSLLALPELQNQLTSLVLLFEKYQGKEIPSINERLYLAGVQYLLRESIDRINQSIKNAITEDPNFYGVQPTLMTTIEPALRDFNRNAEKLITLLQQITAAPAGTVIDSDIAETVLQTRETSFTLWHTVVPELNTMLSRRTDYYRNQMIGALVMAGAALFIAAAFVFLMTRTILTSLHNLQRKAREIAAGNYEARTEVTTGDELGQLAVDFNRMADKVQEYNYNLERLVKERTAELERACTELRQLDELKSNFLSNVSHELRTPLTSVLGFAKIIRKRFEDVLIPEIISNDTKVQRGIQQIKDNINIILIEGERLTKLINDVLDLAKMEAGKMEIEKKTIVIEDIINHASAATASLFEQKKLIFVTEVEENLSPVQGDNDRLIQVLLNLISNAVKFTNNGKVTCQAVKRQGEIIISVIDTGVGISPEDQKQVFDKFKQVGDTLTDKPKGTGLGLPICKQIIELHQGRIWVTSEPGQGSRFSFALPVPDFPYHGRIRPESSTRSILQTLLPVEPVVDNTSTILIVDDEKNIRTLLRHELEEAGYDIDEAENGQEALRKINQKQPALIILDVMMPEINGFDLAAILKSNPDTRQIPIVILSILNDRERGCRVGVDQYLNKPVQIEQLLSAVSSLLTQGGSKKNILVIDNEEPVAGTVIQALKSRGYSVVNTYETEEEIQKVVSQTEQNQNLISLYPDDAQVEKAIRCEGNQQDTVFVLFLKNCPQLGKSG